MSFYDKVGLLFYHTYNYTTAIYLFNNINYIKKKIISFPLERDKFIFMITAIILSSFLMQKRYYSESTNFLHI